jgi:hypothetical protein
MYVRESWRRGNLNNICGFKGSQAVPATTHVSKSKLFYDLRSVSQYVLMSGTLLGSMTRFYFFPFFCWKITLFVLGHPLWREDGSVIFSAICQCSESRRTDSYTLLSHLRLLGSLSIASYDSQGLRWKYSYPPPHGDRVILTVATYIPDARVSLRVIRGAYVIKAMMNHAQTWNYDTTGGENLCHKPSQHTKFTIYMVRDCLPVYTIEVPTDTNMVDANQVSNIAYVLWNKMKAYVKPSAR